MVEYTTKALSLEPSHIKSLLNRSNAYEALSKPEEALEDYKLLLTLQPNETPFFTYKIALLEKKIDELNEKRKEEALNGLKSLGNTILKPFGLNLDSFKMDKNENGSYNISFNK